MGLGAKRKTGWMGAMNAVCDTDFPARPGPQESPGADGRATPRRIDAEADIVAGLAALAHLDPALRPIIARVGAVPLRRRPADLAGLAQIIVGQMISRASAEALWARLSAETGGVRPGALAALGEWQCRRIGLSRAKERALKAADRAVLDGHLDLHRIGDRPVGEAIAALTALPGVGRWTADVYLLFCAGHADVFPTGDVALQAAVGAAFGWPHRPSPGALQARAVMWSPWRGVAARLFWADYAALRKRDAMPVA